MTPRPSGPPSMPLGRRPSASATVARRGVLRARLRPLLMPLLVALAASGCTALDNALASIPIFAFMRESPGFDPYEAPRPPPPGAVPFESPAGDVPPMTQPTPDALVAFGQGPYGNNPLDPTDPAVLAMGQEMYLRHCMVCHGAAGEGTGPIVAPGSKFPLAPAVTTPIAIAHSDGYLYAIIRVGRGLMPAYGARTTHLERWAIVSYVRQLQATAAPAAQPGAGGSN